MRPLFEILDGSATGTSGFRWPGNGVKGGGGSEYLKTALILNQHAFIKI